MERQVITATDLTALHLKIALSIEPKPDDDERGDGLCRWRSIEVSL